jgi:hypothetical protein
MKEASTWENKSSLYLKFREEKGKLRDREREEEKGLVTSQRNLQK